MSVPGRIMLDDSIHLNLLFFKIFYLFIRDRERENMSRGGGRGEGEADSPLIREPDAGLNPRPLRS